MGFLLLVLAPNLRAQSKKMDDSLERVFASGDYAIGGMLSILKELAVNHTDADKKLQYSKQLIVLAEELDSTDYLFQGYLEKGNALRLKSELSGALESYFEGARIAEGLNNRKRLGTINVAIADVYAIMGNNANAMKYHRSAIAILREEKDSVNLASALLNAGDAFLTMDNLDSALAYTEEAANLFEQVHHRLGQAYGLGNLGMIYAKLGIAVQAEMNMNRAIRILTELDEYYPIAVYLAYIGDIYLQKEDLTAAMSYANRSLELARTHGMKEQARDAHLMLSRIYEKMGRLNEAFSHYKSHVAYKDSVTDIVSVQQMADMRTDFEVSRKQIEVDLLNEQKKTQQVIGMAIAGALVLIALLAIVLYRRYRFIRETNRIIDLERGKSESLLLNILPRDTAQELKANGRVQARRFDCATVLFADFQGFTRFAEQLPPEALVQTVDFYFSKFDAIIEQHGLEKIKTVGDAYMCASGLPFPVDDHALSMVRAAIEMAAFVDQARSSASSSNPRLDVRIGINSGPVVAGVVGTKKFAYDIWGDTVNIASRMETASQPGRINITENTHALVHHEFDCEYRGEMEVKNRGAIKMYFVTGKK